MIDGEAVVHEVVLRAAPDAVFDHFVDPAKLARWIGIAADLDPVAGGRFRFEIVPGEHCEGEYVEVERPTRVVVTWGWTNRFAGVGPGESRVTVTLDEVDGGTRLRLVHDRLPGPATGLHDEGWARFLGRLEEEVAA